MSISAFDSASVIPIACRFVPTDQWLVTHIGNACSVSQVKQHLLSRLLPLPSSPAPALRRRRKDRPLSPITFSSHNHGEGEDSDTSQEETFSDSDTLADPQDDGEFYKFKYDPPSRTTGSSSATLTTQAALSSGRVPSTSSTPVRAHITAGYTLVAFSTGQLLEDHFNLAWYTLRPYELLELYPPASALVPLPRHALDAYIRPYYEAHVWALRVVGSEVPAESIAEIERPGTKGKGKERDRRTGSGSGSGISPSDGAEGRDNLKDVPELRKKVDKRFRKKLEWRERMVIIQNGLFRLCKDRDDPRPTHVAPLSALLCLHSGEKLDTRVAAAHYHPAYAPSSSSTCSTPLSSPTHLHAYPHHAYSDPQSAPRKIISAKFRVGPHPPPHSPAHTGPMIQPTHVTAHQRPRSDGDIGGWWRRGSRDELSDPHKGHDEAPVQDLGRSEAGERIGPIETDIDNNGDGVWIVMDMLNNAAHDNLLRILHRHASPICTSSFVTGLKPEPGYMFPQSSTSRHVARSTPPIASVSAPARHDPGGKPGIGAGSQQAVDACVPYPEWRASVVQRARRAGMGALGRAMDQFLFPKPANQDDSDTDSEPEPHTAKSTVDVGTDNADVTSPSLAESSQLSQSPGLWHDLLSDDSDSSTESEPDESEREWESWMEDLRRQRRMLAHTEERRLQQLEKGMRSSWNLDDEVGSPMSSTPADSDNASRASGDEADASESPDTRTEHTTPPVQRTLTSYSSADSLIRRTMHSKPRAARARPRIFEAMADDAWLANTRARPRSPLSSQVQPAPAEMTSAPDSVSSMASSTRLPSRMPIPVAMRMTTMRAAVIEHGGNENPSSASCSDPPGSQEARTKGTGKVNDLINSQADVSTPVDAQVPNRHTLQPVKLKLSLPIKAVESSSQSAHRRSESSSTSSLESMRFVTPDSE